MDTTDRSTAIAGGSGGGIGDGGGRLGRAMATWMLTRRQCEVLRYVVEGLSNKEIGAILGCVEGTVELHLTSIFRKAGVQGRTRLIAAYFTAPHDGGPHALV